MSMSDRVVVQGQANWHRSLRVAYGDGWEDGRREQGERLAALEAERSRYRSALVDTLGWIPADQPEHLRISRLLSDSDA